MEENKTIEMKDEVKMGLLMKVKGKLKNAKNSVLEFMTENPQVIMPLFTCLGAVAAALFHIATNAGEKRLEACRIEDDVTGEKLLAKHPLTNTEILELGSRMIDGEPKAEALQDMGLLR